MADTDAETARRILAYLLEHPEAEDTLEGVAHWWLLEQRIQENLEQVELALRELASAGLVIEQQLGHSPRRYRVNAEKIAEIRRMLDQAQ